MIEGETRARQDSVSRESAVHQIFLALSVELMVRLQKVLIGLGVRAKLPEMPGVIG